MKGDPKVIEQLNAALSSELSAIVQYIVQSEMCQNWGYAKLGGLTKVRAIEEMRHAEGLIERLLFLNATPEVNVPLQPKIGANVKQHLELDLQDELDAVVQYNQAVKICSDAADAGSKELFEHMILDEEQHADFLEWQLHSIEDMGLANYLAQQMKAGEGN
jgi:bacterioferritin